MSLTNEEKEIITDIIDILESDHFAVQSISAQDDNNVCMRFSSEEELCYNVRTLMTEYVLRTNSEPVLYWMSTIGAEDDAERERFAVQVSGECVFSAVLPHPGTGEAPYVSTFTRNSNWVEEIALIRKVLLG